MPRRYPIRGEINMSTTSFDVVPVSATTRPVMSCEITPKALASLTSVQTTQEIPKSELIVEGTSFSGPSRDMKRSSSSKFSKHYRTCSLAQNQTGNRTFLLLVL